MPAKIQIRRISKQFFKNGLSDHHKADKKPIKKLKCNKKIYKPRIDPNIFLLHAINC